MTSPARRPSAEGRAPRQGIEDITDRFATEPITHLGPERTEVLLDLVALITAQLSQTGVIPYPNPIGVPAPE